MIVAAPNFMRECDIVIDNAWGPLMTADFTDKKVFMNMDYFEMVIPYIEKCSNVTLVVHHSDRSFDRIMFEAARPYCSRILSQNCEIIHPKIIQIPIGVQQDPIIPGRRPQLTDDTLRAVRSLDIPKDIDVYVNISLHQNDETKFATVRALRKKCLSYFPDHDRIRRPPEEFFKMLKRSKYVICPIGFGLDTHRFYEAAYMGARPVVVHSGLDDLYRKFGAVIVENWDEPLPEWTPPDVPEEYFHTSYWMSQASTITH